LGVRVEGPFWGRNITFIHYNWFIYGRDYPIAIITITTTDLIHTSINTILIVPLDISTIDTNICFFVITPAITPISDSVIYFGFLLLNILGRGIPIVVLLWTVLEIVDFGVWPVSGSLRELVSFLYYGFFGCGVGARVISSVGLFLLFIPHNFLLYLLHHVLIQLFG
jgi:hypothetical protein